MSLLTAKDTCIFDCQAYSGPTGYNGIGWKKVEDLGNGNTVDWIDDLCTVVDTTHVVFEIEHLASDRLHFTSWELQYDPTDDVISAIRKTLSIPDWESVHLMNIGRIFQPRQYLGNTWTMIVPTFERLAMIIAYCSLWADKHGWDEMDDGLHWQERPADDVPWCDPHGTGRPSRGASTAPATGVYYPARNPGARTPGRSKNPLRSEADRMVDFFFPDLAKKRRS